MLKYDSNLKFKLKKLENFIKEKGKRGVVIAFSGGVDSATLAFLSKRVVNRVIAVTVKSEIVPKYELKDAERIANEIDVEHCIINVDILSNKDFTKNSRNRCYICKKIMIKAIKSFAKSLKIDTIFDGTNLSDLKFDRPGYRAIVEEDIYCPFVYAKITKDEVRNLAKEFGLSFYCKPENSCLATRIPTGEEITVERLKRIEKAEELIRENIGDKYVRVRDYNSIARVEVRDLFLNKSLREKIANCLKDLGYRYVTFIKIN